MTISLEKRDALIAQVNESAINEQARAKILSLLNQPQVSAAELDEIAALIQADIDADLNTLAPGFTAEMEQDPEEKAILEEGKARILEVADDLDDSMAFVEKTTKELEEASTSLAKTETEIRTGEVKSNLGISAP